MAASFRTWACLLLLSGLPFLAGAQAALPVHVIRSISPAEADFQDLDFLAQEIGPARVVMLGEPTHEEGNRAGQAAFSLPNEQ